MAAFFGWLRHSGGRNPQFLSDDGQRVRFNPRYAQDRRFVSDSRTGHWGIDLALLSTGAGGRGIRAARRGRSTIAIMASLCVMGGWFG